MLGTVEGIAIKITESLQTLLSHVRAMATGARTLLGHDWSQQEACRICGSEMVNAIISKVLCVVVES